MPVIPLSRPFSASLAPEKKSGILMAMLLLPFAVVNKKVIRLCNETR
jgi:hypothetical protein